MKRLFYLTVLFSILLFRTPHLRAEEPEALQADVEETNVVIKESEEFPVTAPYSTSGSALILRSNALPWLITIPNIGAEYIIAEKWSAVLDVWFCPWKLSDKFSVKTVAILPEGRYWLKTYKRGSFFNVHLNIAWFNVRANDYRYQDTSRPLLGGGIGYGYRLEFNDRWGIEFEIGAGVANTKYNRYYNVANGALKDTRVSTYWGIDRLGVTFTYYLCDL